MTSHTTTKKAAMVQLITRDGLVLAVRPASSADEALLEAFFDDVSAEDRRFRFLAASTHIGHGQLVPLTDVDHWRTESFLAFDQEHGMLVASAMLACDARMDTGEIAVRVSRSRRGLDHARPAGARGRKTRVEARHLD